MPTDWSKPPSESEVEINLLGRGFGESIVAHVCDGDWLVIDSLRDKAGKSAPVEFLKALGVAADKVRFILATHWHDDHVAGISDLYEWAHEAVFGMPIVKDSKELRRYVQSVDPTHLGNITSGVDELRRLIELKKLRVATIRHLQSDMMLFRKHSLAANAPVEFSTLSPNSADVDAFVERLATLAVDNGIAQRLMDFNPNHISVAAWLRVGADAILLGADLEQVANDQRGWKAVIASRERPHGKASLYKVAHHGSDTSHNEQIWSELLCFEPIAFLSPYNRGVGVPKRLDVERIIQSSKEAYSTKQSPFRKFRDGRSIVQTTLESSGIKIRSGSEEVGVVRLRKDIISGEPWSVELSGGASSLRDFVPRD